MTDDAELLRRYADERSEKDFAELVRRHLGLVYHAALRQCGGDAHRAQDVAQAVFTDVARKAGSLARRPALAGWLHTSTRFAAAQAVRGEVRRQRREQEAHAMNEILAKANDDAAAAEWERMRPVIDEALHALPERDREAVLARFFEGRAFAEIGARLAVSEDAARMRVERALEKLRVALVKRGVNSTAAALGVALANQAGATVPAGVAASVTSAALAGAVMAGAGGGLAGGMLTFMSTTKTTMGVVAAVALAAVGAAIYEAAQVKLGDARQAEVNQQQSALLAKIANLEGRLKAESARAQAADADSGKLLQAVESFQKGAGARALEASKPIPREVVEGRFTRALQMAKNGQHEEALKEFLWCYDEGMVRVTSLLGQRSAVLKQIFDLGAQYPEALAVLRGRRDAVEARVLLKANDAEAGATFASINQLLNERERTFTAYDKMEPGSEDRMRLGTWVFDELIERRRYQDALAAKPFAMMSSTFENWANARNQNVAGTEAKAQMNRSKWIEGTVKNVEVLAGAGALADARSLTTRLLRVDGTEKTRSLLQQRLERAGQPGWLAAGAAGGK